MNDKTRHNYFATNRSKFSAPMFICSYHQLRGVWPDGWNDHRRGGFLPRYSSTCYNCYYWPTCYQCQLLPLTQRLENTLCHKPRRHLACFIGERDVLGQVLSHWQYTVFQPLGWPAQADQMTTPLSRGRLAKKAGRPQSSDHTQTLDGTWPRQVIVGQGRSYPALLLLQWLWGEVGGKFPKS